jgi:hypothetical protein
MTLGRVVFHPGTFEERQMLAQHTCDDLYMTDEHPEIAKTQQYTVRQVDNVASVSATDGN